MTKAITDGCARCARTRSDRHIDQKPGDAAKQEACPTESSNPEPVVETTLAVSPRLRIVVPAKRFGVVPKDAT